MQIKILFIPGEEVLDYQSAALFHGLHELKDVEVYSVIDLWFMFDNTNPNDLLKQYGMGFSLTGLLPSHKKKIISWKEALLNVKKRWFDVIIYGAIHKNSNNLDYISDYYDKNRIILIDGEDFNGVYGIKKIGKLSFDLISFRTRVKCLKMSKKGIYFKREISLIDAKKYIPISFAIPRSKIVDNIPIKKMDMATIIPGDKSTYIYTNEKDYYNGYQIAKFGITFKKAGWDCMRHYEILANGCIPYFPDLRKCPLYTMKTFPKDIILRTNHLYEQGKMSERLYAYYSELLLNYTRTFLTTDVLAQYVLSYIDLDHGK